jgi:hypothetical protein
MDVSRPLPQGMKQLVVKPAASSIDCETPDHTESNINITTAYCSHHGSGPVAGTQLNEYVLYMVLDRMLSDLEIGGNDFISLSLSNHTQNVEFSRGE